MSAAPDFTAHDARIFRKVTWRILPLLFFCYILAYLDRVNVGFAKLSMTVEPWFNDAVFATGAGIFFVGYFLFEIPGNIILHRVGARLWIARIMIGWGLVSALMAWSHSASTFVFLRFLLGVAEAGFFPGIILYLTYWYPRQYRARMVALFMTAIAVAGVVGGPLSGWILEATKTWPPLHPWQWLFVLEGIPTVLVGCAVPFLLTDRPDQASWLQPEEKARLGQLMRYEEEQITQERPDSSSIRAAFLSPKLWLCCAIYFSLIVGLYGVSFWLPQMIKDTLTAEAGSAPSEMQIGLYSAIPWACAALGMVLVGGHSDRTGERRWHIALSAFLGTAGCALMAVPDVPAWGTLLIFSIAITGVMSAISSFWALPTAMLSGTAAAAGIAWVNSLGNLSGFLSPQMVAWLKNHFSMGVAFMGVGIMLALGGVLTLCIRPPRPRLDSIQPGSRRD